MEVTTVKAAANVIAIAGWLGFLAAFWYPLLAGQMPPVGFWIAATVLSFLVGLIIPSYLINLEARQARLEGRATQQNRPRANRE